MKMWRSERLLTIAVLLTLHVLASGTPFKPRGDGGEHALNNTAVADSALPKKTDMNENADGDIQIPVHLLYIIVAVVGAIAIIQLIIIIACRIHLKRNRSAEIVVVKKKGNLSKIYKKAPSDDATNTVKKNPV